jgi:hypothetical protein
MSGGKDVGGHGLASAASQLTCRDIRTLTTARYNTNSPTSDRMIHSPAFLFVRSIACRTRTGLRSMVYAPVRRVYCEMAGTIARLAGGRKMVDNTVVLLTKVYIVSGIQSRS